jgi:hypothetical protein
MPDHLECRPGLVGVGIDHAVLYITRGRKYVSQVML